MLKIGLSRPQNVSSVSPRSMWGCFPFLQAPRNRKLPSELFRSNWRPGQARSTPPDRIKKNVFFDPVPDRSHIHLIRIEESADGDFLQPSPSRSGEHIQIDLGETSDPLRMRREIPVSNISGAKAHASVLKRDFFNLTTTVNSSAYELALRTLLLSPIFVVSPEYNLTHTARATQKMQLLSLTYHAPYSNSCPSLGKMYWSTLLAQADS